MFQRLFRRTFQPLDQLTMPPEKLREIDYSGFAIPLRLLTKEGELSFISTVTVFGTPIDITLSELAIESFFPADEETAEIMSRVFK